MGVSKPIYVYTNWSLCPGPYPDNFTHAKWSTVYEQLVNQTPKVAYCTWLNGVLDTFVTSHLSYDKCRNGQMLLCSRSRVLDMINMKDTIATNVDVHLVAHIICKA